MTKKGKGKGKYRPTAWDDVEGCGRTVARLSSKVAKMAALMNTEVKWGLGSGSGTITNSFTFVHTNTLAQGTDDGERIGDSIRLVKLHMICIVKTVGSSLAQLVTLAIVMKKSVMGAAIDPAAVWYNQGPPQIRQKSTLQNYSILAEKQLTLVPTADSAVFVWDIEIPLGMHTLYSGTSAAITDVAQNLIDLAFTSDQSANQPSITYKFVTEYVDD
jgi:hypothetical protein